MKIVHKYILKELLKSFLLTFTILTLIVFLISIWQIIRNYSDYIQLSSLIAIIPFIIGKSISFTLPMSLLPAVTIVYGRMAHENEILILRTSGIAISSYLYPAILVGVFSSILCLYLNCEFVPKMYKKRDELDRYALNLLFSASFKSGESSFELPNIKIRYGYLDDGKFHDLFIQRYKHIEKEEEHVYPITEEVVAENGMLVFNTENSVLTFELENGSIAQLERDFEFGGAIKEKRFDFKYISFPLSFARERKDNNDGVKHKQMAELVADTRTWRKKLRIVKKEVPKYDRKNETYKNYYEHVVELHRRLSSSFTPIIIILIGAPLGIIVRHSNRLVAFGVSAIPVFIIYYPLMMTGKALAEKAKMSVFPAMWMCNFVMLFIALVLIIWVARK